MDKTNPSGEINDERSINPPIDFQKTPTRNLNTKLQRDQRPVLTDNDLRFQKLLQEKNEQIEKLEEENKRLIKKSENQRIISNAEDSRIESGFAKNEVIRDLARKRLENTIPNMDPDKVVAIFGTLDTTDRINALTHHKIKMDKRNFWKGVISGTVLIGGGIGLTIFGGPFVPLGAGMVGAGCYALGAGAAKFPGKSDKEEDK